MPRLVFTTVVTSLFLAALSGRSADAQSPDSAAAAVAVGPQQGRLHVGAQYSASFNSRIVKARGLVVSAHYSLLERLRLGMSGGYWSNSLGDVGQLFRSQGADIARDLKSPYGSPYELTWSLAADLQFTPVYAQLRLADDLAAAFDIYIPLSAGLAQMSRPLPVSGDVNGEFDRKFSPVFNFGLGARLHFATWLAMTVEFRDYLFLDPVEQNNALRTRPHMQVGFQFSLGGGPEMPSVSARSWEEFMVAGTFEMGAQMGATFFDAFTNSLGPSLSVAYHLSDTWSVELFGTKVFSREGQLRTDLLNDFSFHGTFLRPTVRDIELLWATGATAHFSPFAGRVDAFGQRLAITPYLALGFGLGHTRLECEPGSELDPNAFDGANCPSLPADADASTITYEPNTLRALGVLGAGVRLRLSELFALRIEVRDYFYSARVFRPYLNTVDQVQTGVRHHVFSQIGLSVFFGG